MLLALFLAIAVAGPLDTRLLSAERVPVFVGPGLRNGFVDVDRGVLDSIRDIRGEITRSPILSLVDERGRATIVLEVTGRRISGRSGGVVVPVGGVVAFVPFERRAVDFTVRAGEYQRLMASEGSDSRSWKGAAKQVVTDVGAWIQANRDRLPTPPKAPSTPRLP